MTTEQVIKDLNACLRFDDYGDRNCIECSQEDWRVCKDNLMKQALDLINRQKAEIEKLKEQLADARYLNTVAESDGIKEFAERLKATITINNTSDGYLDYAIDYSCLMGDIDNLVKEMTEEKENDQL